MPSQLTDLKKQEDKQWLKDVDCRALQNTLIHLSDGFDRYFNQQNKAPRFKRKNRGSQSYSTSNGNNTIRIENNKIRLPKIGFIRFANSRKVKGKIIGATIKVTASGKYFFSIQCKEESKPLSKTNSSVGIDLGINHFAVCSDGRRIQNGRFIFQMEKKIIREQRKLSRRYIQAKKEGKDLLNAKNYQKQRIKVARLMEQVKHRREDFLNKLSTEFIKSHDVICIEDLNSQGMMMNRSLPRHISDVSWSAFIRKLEYKAEWYGKEVIKISRWYPSSQLCSSCGQNGGKRSLKVREWDCPHCFAHHDRDLNASINILNEGLNLLQT